MDYTFAGTRQAELAEVCPSPPAPRTPLLARPRKRTYTLTVAVLGVFAGCYRSAWLRTWTATWRTL